MVNTTVQRKANQRKGEKNPQSSQKRHHPPTPTPNNKTCTNKTHALHTEFALCCFYLKSGCVCTNSQGAKHEVGLKTRGEQWLSNTTRLWCVSCSSLHHQGQLLPPSDRRQVNRQVNEISEQVPPSVGTPSAFPCTHFEYGQNRD